MAVLKLMKCDRCGKTHKYYPSGAKYQANSFRRLMVNNNDEAINNDSIINLCPECMDELDRWMIGGKFG